MQPAVAGPLRLQLPARREALEEARLAVLGHLEAAQPSPRLLYQVELVLEEVLMNIVWHAYPAGDEHAIGLEVDVEPQAVVLQFEDDGVPFDPTLAEPRPAPASIDEAIPGGLGLLLVRKFARSMDYARVGSRNRLRIALSRD